MDTIDSVSRMIGKVFRLECRASRGSVRESTASGLITPFKLEDMTGAIPGYFPVAADKPGYPHTPNTLVVVLVEIEERAGRPVARIYEMLPLNLPMRPARCLPRSWCALPDLLPCLADCVESLTYTPLVEFMASVLKDERIMKSFLTIPASVDNHHSYPSGLLMHSLECAARVHNFLGPDADLMSMELGTVAALLHDVGKIEVLTSDMRYQPSARLLKHDGYTREVLGPHLLALNQQDPDTATALRYLLSKDEECSKYPLAMVVKLADHYSAASDASRLAFSGVPDWQQLAGIKGRGPKRIYWRSRKNELAHGSKRMLKVPK